MMRIKAYKKPQIGFEIRIEKEAKSVYITPFEYSSRNSVCLLPTITINDHSVWFSFLKFRAYVSIQRYIIFR